MRRPFASVCVLLGLVAVPVAWAEAPTAPARELESRLTPPVDVVILGNSKVRTDLDLDRLQTELPAPAPHYIPMGLPGSQAPAWYAVLRERVYGSGAAPKGVVIYAPLFASLVTTLPNGVARAQVAAQLTAASPPSLLRLFGGALPDSLRDQYLHASGSACAPDRTKVPELSQPVESLPVAESYLSEIVKLATEHHSRVLFVRQPVAPSGALEDEVSSADEAVARALVTTAGGGWVDLRGALGDERFYGDGVHMNEAGRRETTDRLAHMLTELGDWLGTAPLPAPAFVAPLPAPRWTSPPTMPAATFKSGGACVTTALLPPELAALAPERLRAAGFAGASPLAPSLWAKALALRESSSATCDQQWTVDGASLRVAVASAKQKGVHLLAPGAAAAKGDEGAAGWWLGPGATLHVEAGTPGSIHVTGWAPTAVSLSVDRKTLELPPGMVSFDTRATASGLDLVGTSGWLLVRSAGGSSPAARRTIDLFEGAFEAAAPPPLPALPALSRPGRFPSERFADATALHLPEVDDTFAASGVPGCSPLRSDLPVHLALRGTSVSVENEGCAALTFTSLPVHLDPARGCGNKASARWVYPGDVQTWRTTVDGSGSTWSFELAGGVLGPAGAAALHVTVRDDQGPLLDQTLPLETLRFAPPRWPLPRPPAGAVVVQVSSPADAPWVLLGRGALVAED